MPDFHNHDTDPAAIGANFGRLLGPVARELLGEPQERHRGGREWRYGTHGSLKVETDLGVWHDHEANIGGGTLRLLEHRAGLDKAGALGWLRERGLIEDRPKPEAPRRRSGPVASYDYHDEAGALLFQVCRIEPKDFRQRRPDGKGGWVWDMQGVQRVLYRLPELVAAVGAGRRVYIAEGEKAVDRLASLGLAATCSPGGAGKWRKAYSAAFAGADVVILPDNDGAGREHAGQVAASLRPVARSVRIVALPDLPPKGDAFDWIAAGGTAAQLEELATRAEPLQDDDPAKPQPKPGPPQDDDPAKPQPKPPPQDEPRERKAEAGQRAEREAPRMYPARELMALNLPPLRFVLNELLPIGYTVLAGPPKLGKSWLAYQLALAVASGADLFGQATWQGEVLYLALEDGERRVQARMGRLLDGSDAPEALCVATKWPRLDKGGFEEIEAWAQWRGDRARLCIIDTSQKIKPSAARAGNAYEQDYELHGQLHAQAHRLGIALVNITHMRKGGAKLDDWLEGVLGSGGITGSADTIIGLQRDRGAADAFLKVTGRDVREEELALRSDDGVWSCLGAARDVRMNETKQRILAAMAEGGDRGLPPKEIAAAAGLRQDTVRQTLKRMLAAGTVMDKGGGRYACRIG